MKYLCLVYLDEKILDALSSEEAEALGREAEVFHRELGATPGYLAAALQPSQAAITVRRRGGQLSTTDGPFAETKEQLGGVVLIDAENLDEALGVAARVPSARFGSVEVRPIRELERPSVPQTATTQQWGAHR
jgi:hypothetical protein